MTVAKNDIEYVDPETKKVRSMNADIQACIDKRGAPPPHMYFQRPGGDYRVVLRYGAGDYDEVNFTQGSVFLAIARRSKQR